MSNDWYDAYLDELYGPTEAELVAQGYQVVSPAQQMLEEVRALKAEIAQEQQARAQQQQLAQQLDQLGEHVDAELDRLGVISRELGDAVVLQATQMPRGPDGLPDVRGAYEALVAAGEIENEQIAALQPDERPGMDATVNDLAEWAGKRLVDMQHAQRDAQRAQVEHGAMDRQDAQALPAWEREGREPNTDPTSAEGLAYWGEQYEALSSATGGEQ